MNVKDFTEVGVSQEGFSHDYSFHLFKSYLMISCPYPRNNDQSQSCQRGKDVGPLRPNVSIVVDHSNESFQPFSVSRILQLKNSLHFLSYWSIPFCVIQYPKYSSSVLQSEHFEALIF